MLSRNTNSTTQQDIINETIINDSGKIIDYKKTITEICIAVSLHTVIMASFEIYFYFQYIIIIEKELFYKK